MRYIIVDEEEEDSKSENKTEGVRPADGCHDGCAPHGVRCGNGHEEGG